MFTENSTKIPIDYIILIFYNANVLFLLKNGLLSKNKICTHRKWSCKVWQGFGQQNAMETGEGPSPLHLVPGPALLPLHSLQPSAKQYRITCEPK